VTESAEELKRRYLVLRGTYGGLVGTLYPGIAYNQLLELLEAYRTLTGMTGWCDLPPIPPPNRHGQAPHFQ